MNTRAVTDHSDLTGDDLLRILSALANPHRLQIVAALQPGRNYVSQLARELGISRPLLHMHLQRLENAGLVTGALELSEDGRAMKYFEVTPFAVTLTPEWIAEAVKTLTQQEAAGRIDEAESKETEGNS
jgi:predicted transcriptional regulator